MPDRPLRDRLGEAMRAEWGRRHGDYELLSWKERRWDQRERWRKRADVFINGLNYVGLRIEVVGLTIEVRDERPARDGG